MSSQNPAMRSHKSGVMPLRLTFLLEIVLNQDIIFMTDLFCYNWWTLGMLFSFFHLKDFIIFFNIYLFNCGGS